MCHNFVRSNNVFCRCFWCVSNGMTLEPALSAALWWELSSSAWPKKLRDQKWSGTKCHKPCWFWAMFKVQLDLSTVIFHCFLNFCFRSSSSIIVEKAAGFQSQPKWPGSLSDMHSSWEFSVGDYLKCMGTPVNKNQKLQVLQSMETLLSVRWLKQYKYVWIQYILSSLSGKYWF